MFTGYPSGVSVQQPQSPPIVQTRVDVRLQSPKDMSSEQLALWLRKHPSLSGAEYEEDISKLKGIYMVSSWESLQCSITSSCICCTEKQPATSQ